MNVLRGEGQLVDRHAAGTVDHARVLAEGRKLAGAPIPGETRTSDGRPAWNPRTLLDWYSQRKIAGNQTHQPD